MLTNTYTMYDSKAKTYMKTFDVRNDGEAIRLLTTWVNDSSTQTNINKYPEHFSLWKIGQYDDQSGKYVNNEEGPEEIIQAIQCVEEPRLTHEQWYEKTAAYFNNSNVTELKTNAK